MKLDSYEGHLFIEKDGKDGVVVLTLQDRKQFHFEEKDGEIHVTELSSRDNPNSPDGIVVRTGRGDSSPLALTQSIHEFVADLLLEAQNGELSDAHARVLEAAEREVFSQAIQLADGNQARAARWLGVSRLTMREKLTKFGIHPSQDEP